MSSDNESNYSEADALFAGNEIVQQYLIGFVAIGTEGSHGRPTTSLGSGTLIFIGGVRGILTAAHVVAAIKQETEVGILRFGAGQSFQGLRVLTALLDFEVIGGEETGEAGPDIAFVKLPLTLESHLLATNVFFSPEAHYVAMQHRGENYRESQLRFAMGVLGVATRQVSTDDGSYGATFKVFPAIGEIEDRFEEGEFDSFTFRVAYADDLEPPTSYGGMSGGAVWQVMDDAPPLNRVLLGVLFRETGIDEKGHRLLIGNGPVTLYERLLQQVTQRWASHE